MPALAFYPYIPANSTLPNTASHAHNTTTLYVAASTPTGTNPNEAGTSLSMAGIAGIVIAVLVLFGGLAWFVKYAVVTVPERKRAALGGKRTHRARGEDV
jgi:hypothetical protein